MGIEIDKTSEDGPRGCYAAVRMSNGGARVIYRPLVGDVIELVQDEVYTGKYADVNAYGRVRVLQNKLLF